MSNFVIAHSGNELRVKFDSATLTDAVGRFEFCSRLLNSLAPNDDGTWIKSASPRVDAHIVGFPPTLDWTRPNKVTLVATSLATIDESIVKTLTASLLGICNGSLEGTERLYTFAIVDNATGETFTYSFSSRAREVSTLCVLWDGVEHPRDHLEVWRDPAVKFLGRYPEKQSSVRVKTYGDPSKTVDALRNQGFPRATDQSPRGTSIEMRRFDRYGGRQEHYKLVTRHQHLEDRVGRSQIPKRFRTQLYASANNCCANCGQQFDEANLVPDHRVPSIVQKDNLSESNYLEVLQTFCIRCNQVKREACKKCPYNHNCAICSWAYPEKFSINKDSMALIRKAATEAKFDGDINKFISWLLS
jgi:hypothetical protein